MGYSQNTICHYINCSQLGSRGEGGLHALDFFEDVNEMYGVNEDMSVQDDSTVNVPSNRFELSVEHLTELRHIVNPLNNIVTAVNNSVLPS